MEFSRISKIKELYTIEALKEVAPYFWGQNPEEIQTKMLEMNWNDLNQRDPAWAFEDFKYGLERLLELAEQQKVLFDVYTEEEIRLDSYKEVVKLLYMPAKQKKTDRYILLCAGGTYINVCTIAESVPVAAKLNELGYHVFCLNYRTFQPKFEYTGLMPAPIEDVASALRYIDFHAEKFGVEAGNYAVGGFSAGGHLVSMWGTKQHGYLQYKMKKPKCVIMNYPLISAHNLTQETIIKWFLEQLAGKGATEEELRNYLVYDLLDGDYPAVYILQCEDDEIVPPYNCTDMVEIMEKNRITYKYEFAKMGGHGYGLGSKTDVAGWVERVDAFLDCL